jgi:DNA-binding MurR/RpiR family transcriptional regulator
MLFTDKSWEECKLHISEKLSSIESRVNKIEDDSTQNKSDMAVAQHELKEVQKHIEQLFKHVDSLRVDNAVNKVKIGLYVACIGAFATVVTQGVVRYFLTM